MGWKAIQGIVATKKVIRNRAYGYMAIKPFRASVAAILTAAISFGGYWFAELSYLWLGIAFVNLFTAFLVFGQSCIHDPAVGLDAELSLAMDSTQTARKIRTRRWESLGQIGIILVWIYAWRNVLIVICN